MAFCVLTVASFFECWRGLKGATLCRPVTAENDVRRYLDKVHVVSIKGITQSPYLF